MLVKDKLSIEGAKLGEEHGRIEGKVEKLKTKEMILNRTDEISIIRHLAPAFDPTNTRINYKSKCSSSISIYWGKVSKKWKFKCHQTGHEGDVFAFWGYCHGLDYRTELQNILEHINQKMLLGL